jgi:hypothetical protein
VKGIVLGSGAGPVSDSALATEVRRLAGRVGPRQAGTGRRALGRPAVQWAPSKPAEPSVGRP